MTRSHECCMKAAAAALITGTLAFITVNSFCRHRLRRCMSAAKAFRTIGAYF